MEVQRQSFKIEHADEASDLPSFLEKLLVDFGLLDAFQSQSPTLRAGFVSLITSAQRQDLRDERIAAMLDGLANIDRKTEKDPEHVDFAACRSSS
jgi:Bacteriocin-protection, YdeI or OmpD-Associated